jgi:hypothetical protein
MGLRLAYGATVEKKLTGRKQITWRVFYFPFILLEMKGKLNSRPAASLNLDGFFSSGEGFSGIL